MQAIMRDKILMLPPGVYTLPQVLREAVEVVKDQVERLDMGYWCLIHPKDDLDKLKSRVSLLSFKIPECQTVACLAGWGALLIDGMRVMSGLDFLEKFSGLENLSEWYSRPEWYHDLNQIFNSGVQYSGQSQAQVEWLAETIENYLSIHEQEIEKYTVTVR